MQRARASEVRVPGAARRPLAAACLAPGISADARALACAVSRVRLAGWQQSVATSIAMSANLWESNCSWTRPHSEVWVRLRPGARAAMLVACILVCADASARTQHLARPKSKEPRRRSGYRETLHERVHSATSVERARAHALGQHVDSFYASHRRAGLEDFDRPVRSGIIVRILPDALDWHDAGVL